MEITANPLDERQNPAKVINRVAKLVTKYFDRKLANAGINVTYLAVLGPLSSTPALSQKELAVSAGSSQPAMAELLARLVKEGFLSRSQDTRDKRQVLFSLTPKSVSILPEISSVIREGNAELFSALGDDGMKELLLRLAQIERRLEEL